jgi:hypothetical protein
VALKTILFTILVPGTLLGIVPWLLYTKETEWATRLKSNMWWDEVALPATCDTFWLAKK